MRLRTLVLRESSRQEPVVHQFSGDLAGNHGDRFDQNITHYSEGAIAQEMDSLGANVLVLPKSATLQEYYRADLQSETIPEEYVTELAMAKLEGIDNVRPSCPCPLNCKAKALR